MTVKFTVTKNSEDMYGRSICNYNVGKFDTTEECAKFIEEKEDGRFYVYKETMNEETFEHTKEKIAYIDITFINSVKEDIKGEEFWKERKKKEIKRKRSINSIIKVEEEIEEIEKEIERNNERIKEEIARVKEAIETIRNYK